jgi:DNA-binding SARP family transcriptional activator/streptogramin lyase
VPIDVAPSLRCHLLMRGQSSRDGLPNRSQPSTTGDSPRFRLLGTVRAWGDRGELELGGPLQLALLAMLLLNAGRVVSREQLIDGLWEAEPPPRAGRSLETKVSRLRAALGDSANVVARSGGYVFQASAEDVDVYRFEQALDEGRSLLAEQPAVARARLEGALALWRGRPLSGLPDGVLAVERARLEAERLEALEARIDADLALWEGTSLVGELQELRSEYPARERFAEQLMLALYRSGRQTDALEVYRETYRRLRDELGLDPNPRLRELERAILRQDESLGPLPLRARARLAGDSWRPRLTGVIAVGCVLALAVIFVASSGGSHQRPVSHGPGLILVDAATGAVRADVSVGDSTGGTRFGYGHLWTLGENGVMAEIDPVNGALVRFVPVGVVWGGMAVGAGGIWVSDRYGSMVLRIDPGTGQINLRRRVSSLGLSGLQPNSGIAIDAGSLWVARGPEAVDRLDPSSLKLQRRIELRQHGCSTGGAQCFMAAGDGRVWVAGGNNGWLARIDEATDRVRVFHGLQPYLCCLAVGGGSVWVAEAHDIARIAPDGRVLRRYPFASANIGDMAFDDGTLWASADTTGQLLRIDARTGQLRSIHLGNLLIAAAASHGTVAVSAVPLPTVPTHGLGSRVLRVGLQSDWLNNTDPAVAKPPHGTGRWQWQLQHAICGGLYTRPDAPGSRTLVPDVASGPARASPGGRTWTIPIRTGVRFSPPLNRAVTAEDVRATLVRALSPDLGPTAPAARILGDVVGLESYRDRRSSDVSGIAVRKGALVITTRRPVRDLPARLALPYFCVLPAGTPTPLGGYEDPLPTAGPYYLAEHEGGVLAVVRPNPGYSGTRPGRLDGIVFRIDIGERAAITRVRHGQLDYFTGRSTAVSGRVGCRTKLPGIPGLDLAAICIRSTAG